MKKILFTLIVLCANTVSAQYFPVDTLALNRSYAKLVENPADTTAQWEFFNAFPDLWYKFLYTYNYISDPNYDLTMHNAYYNHCDMFGSLTAIPDSVYCKKIVDVAVGALNDADAMRSLQDLQHNSMKARREPMLKAITSMMAGDRMLYWQFYWSEPLRPERVEIEYKELDAYMRSNGYADEADLMKIAFDYFFGKSSYGLEFPHVDLRKYEGKDY